MNETRNYNLRIYYLESRVDDLHGNMREQITVIEEVIKELDKLVKMNQCSQDSPLDEASRMDELSSIHPIYGG